MKLFGHVEDVVLDPFMGSGTMLVAARKLRRCSIGIELKEEFCELAVKRLAQMPLGLEMLGGAVNEVVAA